MLILLHSPFKFAFLLLPWVQQTLNEWYTLRCYQATDTIIRMYNMQAYKTYKLGGKMSELLYSPATYGVDFSSKTMLKPRARQAPMMAVVKNALWLMGGIVEVTEHILDITLCEVAL